jgi:hypothetical protein
VGQRAIQADVLQISTQALPTACKDSPDPIAGTSLAGDTAANFKSFASPASAPDVLFGLVLVRMQVVTGHG